MGCESCKEELSPEASRKVVQEVVKCMSNNEKEDEEGGKRAPFCYSLNSDLAEVVSELSEVMPFDKSHIVEISISQPKVFARYLAVHLPDITGTGLLEKVERRMPGIFDMALEEAGMVKEEIKEELKEREG